ncbi:MAG: 6-phosphogluconolactonase [Patescibacteria group bacterium]
MSFQILYNPSKDELRKQTTEKLQELLKYPEVLLLLSGGSALELLDSIDPSVLTQDNTITVLDERFSQDPSINNFAQIMTTDFYRAAVNNGCSFLDTRPHEENMEQVARRFEHDLRNWKTAHPSGLMIATQGIGPDGHTSGIMPYPEDATQFAQLFKDENRWITAYNAGNKNQYPLRITTTIFFLKMIDHSILYATGENKKDVLKKAIDTDTKLHEFPSRVIQDMKDVLLYTDQDLL